MSFLVTSCYHEIILPEDRVNRRVKHLVFRGVRGLGGRRSKADTAPRSGKRYGSRGSHAALDRLAARRTVADCALPKPSARREAWISAARRAYIRADVSTLLFALRPAASRRARSPGQFARRPAGHASQSSSVALALQGLVFDRWLERRVLDEQLRG